MIVDDSASVRNGLCGILRAHADIALVGMAEDGLEAIAQAEKLVPDVILMDAQMPGMDGIETTRRIKELLPEIKVLVLAVHTGSEKAAIAAGAEGVLMKDSGRADLLRAIRELGHRDR